MSRRSRLPGSKLGRLILLLNLLALAVLLAGALVLNELRRGLVESRTEALAIQVNLIANTIEAAATYGEPEPYLDEQQARNILLELFVADGQRARLLTPDGRVIADSDNLAAEVRVRELPPARRPGEPAPPAERNRREERAREALVAEVRRAAESGARVEGFRPASDGRRVISVSQPIQHVQAVLGVLTIQAGDVDAIIAAERRALIPFALVAGIVALASFLVMNGLVAQPIERLARAADRVRLARARAISLPDLSQRTDEIGDLTQSLESMTDALSTRMDAIEAFAADVAHEIRNPLTSIRSAVETLELVPEGPGRARLLGVLKHDVSRLDRLITDIANASRLDAELSRDAPRAIDLRRLLGEIVHLYEETRRAEQPGVHLQVEEGPAAVLGREGPLGQVFRNLIDNARSFSPADGIVRVAIAHLRNGAPEVQVSVEDDGPGVPPENLETVFERFYTARPKGSAFGGNSGLGLSIARQIVEAHGGRIWAENRAGDDGRVLGAAFRVRLPEARP